MSADEALAIGLVHEVAGDGELGDRVRRMAQDVCKLAPVSVQLAKQIIDAGSGAGTAWALEGMAGALTAATQDAREGVASFREKRPPRYRGS